MVKKFDPAIFVAIPLLGIIGGGYLSLPVTSLTRGKEPWTSFLLLLVFALVLWLVGTFGISTTLKNILWSWAAGSAFYLVMLSVGGFRQHIEPFFVAHLMAFVCLMGHAAISNKREQNKASISTPAPPRVQSAMITQPSTHSPILALGQVWRTLTL